MTPDSDALHRVVFSALRSALALTAGEADACLIRAYADQPPPEPASSVNVCYYFLQTDSYVSILQERYVENAVPKVFSFIPCRLVLVFYGPACEAWALRCRSFLFQDGAGEPRQIFRDAGLFPVPVPTAPSVVFEETGTKYRKRADLVVDLRLVDDAAYVSVSGGEPLTVETVESVPSVEIHVSDASL